MHRLLDIQIVLLIPLLCLRYIIKFSIKIKLDEFLLTIERDFFVTNFCIYFYFYSVPSYYFIVLVYCLFSYNE